jgi:FMN phosphatase YigB (HAD superfamily)
MIVKELLEKYPEAVQHPKYPITFAKIAGLGNDNPETLDLSLASWAIPRPLPKTKIKNLIFDLGHIFIRIDLSRTPVYQAFSDLAKSHGKDLSPADIKTLITAPAMDAIILAHHLNDIGTPEFRSKLKTHLDLESISDEEFDTAWCASILDNPVSVKQRLQALQGLIEEGYTIYLLSNNNEIHRLHTKQNFEGLFWGTYFLKQYYSNETGLYKPNPKAYTKVLTDNRLKANETMFFDDVKSYVKAAWGVGIRGRQFTVDYGMNNIKLMIEAINKAESWALDQIGKPIITRESTLAMYAVQKFRTYKAPEPDLSNEGLQRLEEGRRLR